MAVESHPDKKVSLGAFWRPEWLHSGPLLLSIYCYITLRCFRCLTNFVWASEFLWSVFWKIWNIKIAIFTISEPIIAYYMLLDTEKHCFWWLKLLKLPYQIPWGFFGGNIFFFARATPWDLPLPEYRKKIILAIFFHLAWVILLLAFFQPFFRQITWPMAEKNFLTSPHDFSHQFTSLGQKWKKSKFLIPFLNYFSL